MLLPAFCCYLLSISLGFADGHEEQNPIVILISFDGFRWDYLYKTKVPTLAWLSKNGVSATIVNNFVTRTFPNHYSIVTGMYHERHGIINNYMYDPVYNESFSPKTTDPKWFEAAEPVWITNEKAGGGRRSAVVNWVGCAIPIHGWLPNYTVPYNRSIPFKERIDMILDQLDMEPSANFLGTYFEEPDKAGHTYGPNSMQVIKAIQEVDNLTRYLVEELIRRDLFDKVNIILTSDHGMSQGDDSRYIYLDQLINPDTYRFIDSDVNAYIIPHTEKDKHEIYRNLTKAPNLTVFYKEDIPDYWHYRNNRRITPIFIVGDVGYQIFPTRDNRTGILGNHGYNNSLSEMHPFFIAHGPAFKKGYCSEPFSIIHIYELMCYLLGVTPAPNDGDLAAVTHLLHSGTSNYIILGIMMVIAVLIVGIIINGLRKNLRTYVGINKSYSI